MSAFMPLAHHLCAGDGEGFRIVALVGEADFPVDDLIDVDVSPAARVIVYDLLSTSVRPEATIFCIVIFNLGI